MFAFCLVNVIHMRGEIVILLISRKGKQPPEPLKLKVRIKEGTTDTEPYAKGKAPLDFSGYTGVCDQKEYSKAKETDTVQVDFDQDTIRRIPKQYVKKANKLDEDPYSYYFLKPEIEVVG